MVFYFSSPSVLPWTVEYQQNNKQTAPLPKLQLIKYSCMHNPWWRVWWACLLEYQRSVLLGKLKPDLPVLSLRLFYSLTCRFWRCLLLGTMCWWIQCSLLRGPRVLRQSCLDCTHKRVLSNFKALAGFVQYSNEVIWYCIFLQCISQCNHGDLSPFPRILLPHCLLAGSLFWLRFRMEREGPKDGQ